MQTFVHEDSQLEISPLFHLQPMQLTEERGDVVKQQPSSRVHHRLMDTLRIFTSIAVSIKP